MQQFHQDLTFEEWILFTFDHEAEGPVWYHASDDDIWDGPSAATIAYLTRLFNDPVPALEGYSDGQLGQGFWYLVSNGGGDYLRPLLDPTVPLPTRLVCLDAIPTLFEKLFLPRCSPHLSHLDEPGTNPINSPIYMWWDIAPLGAPTQDPEAATINHKILDVMDHILTLPSDPCRESSLHGLGHWASTYPDRTADIIDRFLHHRATTLRPELLTYANAARSACIL